MTTATATQAIETSDKTEIRPFLFEASEAELIELRRRINATRWPERETVTDASQGVSSPPLRRWRATGRPSTTGENVKPG